MFVCVCVCLCVCVCTRERKVPDGGVHGRTCECITHVWVPAFTFHLFEARMLVHTEHTRSASRPASFWASPSPEWASSLASEGLWLCMQIALHRFSGSKLRSWDLRGKHFTHWDASLAQPFFPLLWMPADYLEWWKIAIVILIDSMV